MTKAKGGDGRSIFNDDNQPKTKVAGVDNEQLKSIVDRIDRLKDERDEIGESIKEIKAEAKANGFDIGTINEMLKLRALDKDKLAEKEALRDTYGRALGIFG